MTPEERQQEIRDAIKILGWTKSQFARRYGVSGSALHMWLNGARGVPQSAIQFAKVCVAVQTFAPEAALRVFEILDD